MIFNYDAALEAISDGETDWTTLTRNVGRNDLPHILFEVAWSMTDDELAEAVRQSWVMAEYPEHAVDRAQWLEWFTQLGYRHNTARVEPPSEAVLWRGGMYPDRMAWTADRTLAEWFRDRYPNGRLWTATVHGANLLACYDGVRGESGDGGESEYVIDPVGVEYQEV